MTSRIALVSVAAALGLALTACGERPQVVQYKQGAYQGKLDQKPYATAPWNGNENQWASALRTRNQSQNEYKRTH